MTWAVYTLRGNDFAPVAAVCEQRTFDMKARAEPERYRLVQGDIASEGEAERLARGTAGNDLKSPRVDLRWRFGPHW